MKDLTISQMKQVAGGQITQVTIDAPATPFPAHAGPGNSNFGSGQAAYVGGVAGRVTKFVLETIAALVVEKAAEKAYESVTEPEKTDTQSAEEKARIAEEARKEQARQDELERKANEALDRAAAKNQERARAAVGK